MFACLLLASYITSISHSADTRIVGGSTVSASEHPYIAVILWNSGSLHCGGSIIKKEYPAVIMTAAHCTESDITNTHFVRLYASDYNGAYSTSSNYYVDVSISRVVNHEDYIDADQGDDISLLLILEDISKLSRLGTVSITSLMSNTWAQPWSNGDDMEVVGYGHDSDGGDPTPTLEEVTVPYIKRWTCNQEFTETINQKMICAGAVGYDSCQGDSGGPLLVAGTDEQIGIVSWGYGCAASTPGLYTNVGAYYDWIYEQLALFDCIETVSNELEDDVDVGADEMVYYQVTTDDTTEQLTIAIDVQSGDADLYVRFGANPTESEYDCRPYESDGTETCSFDSAQVGTYYIMIHGYNAVVGLSVAAHKTQCVEDTTTSEPTTAEPTTAEPTTSEPTTAEPTTSEPTTAEPTTAEPTTAEPTVAPTTSNYPLLFVDGESVRLKARDCDLCINDIIDSKKVDLADCDIIQSGIKSVKWRLKVDENANYLQFIFKNKDSKLKMVKGSNNGVGYLKTKEEGEIFQIDYKEDGGVYYIELRHVGTDTCPYWNSCTEADYVQMVDCSSLADSFNIQVLDLEISDVQPISQPELFIVDHYYNLTYLTIVFMAVVFVYWAAYILKMEYQRKENEPKVLNHVDTETDGLMEDL